MLLAAIPNPKTREDWFKHFRAAGFTPDDFAVSREAREVAAVALTRVEDWLECQPYGRQRERERAAVARRALEAELWP